VRIAMRYGTGEIHFDVPEKNVAGVYRPTRELAPAAACPLDSLPASPPAEHLRHEVAGRRALLLTADATRDEPHAEILHAALACLAGASEVTVCITCGSHRADTPGNRAIADDALRLARELGLPAPEILIHDHRTARFTDHGMTSRGTPVRLAAVLDGAELILVASDMKHHYFAGYSNPLKDFLPGIAAFESIERNHRLALEPESTFGRHPFHPSPERRTNPLADDMREAYELAVGTRPCYALATITLDGRVAHAHLAPLPAAAAWGMELCDRLASFTVPAQRHVVVSAGGSPMDENLYLAQRGIELTRAAIADGARVLLLAECAEGIADGEAAYRNFYLELTRPLPEILERIRAGYRLYQHKAYKFADLLQRIEVLSVTSLLPPEDVRAAHLEPAPDPQETIRGWLREDPAARILFFDEANRLCVLAPRES
jgi:nickel-dependent lactate racemase